MDHFYFLSNLGASDPDVALDPERFPRVSPALSARAYANASLDAKLSGSALFVSAAAPPSVDADAGCPEDQSALDRLQDWIRRQPPALLLDSPGLLEPFHAPAPDSGLSLLRALALHALPEADSRAWLPPQSPSRADSAAPAAPAPRKILAPRR